MRIAICDDKTEVSSPDRDSILCSNDDPLSDTVFYVGRGGVHHWDHSSFNLFIVMNK